MSKFDSGVARNVRRQHRSAVWGDSCLWSRQHRQRRMGAEGQSDVYL